MRTRKLRASLNDDCRLELIFGKAATWRNCPDPEQPLCCAAPLPPSVELPPVTIIELANRHHALIK